MRIFAIADLHLPGGDVKPMDVFGAHWERHFERISEDWRARVGEEDVVLLPGDTSWAMQLRERPARPFAHRGLCRDARFSCGATTTTGGARCRACAPRCRRVSMHCKTNALLLSGTALCRHARLAVHMRRPAGPQDPRAGGAAPGAVPAGGAPPVRRRAHRCHAALSALSGAAGADGFTRLLSEYGVRVAVYGHLHGASTARAFNGLFEGVRYQLVSCDALRFALCEIES